MRGIDGPDGTPSLKGDLRKAVKRGFIKGLDGRHIFIRSDHSALNFLLQSGGAVVMKMALADLPLSSEASRSHGVGLRVLRKCA
jgi:DNA polymerase-1